MGGDGADYLQDSEGNNTALGGAGNDTIYGAGLIEGGADNDTLSYLNAYLNGAYAPNTVYGGEGNDSIWAWGNYVNGTLLDGGAGNDTINGSSYNESIIGGSGNDSLNGQGGADSIDAGSGDDTIVGDAGNDTIDGGDGSDRVIYTGTIDQYTVLRDGSDFLVYDNRSGAPDGVDRLRNVETLVFSGGVEFQPTAANTGTLQTGTAANDALSGSAFGDQIDADAGNDTILGLGGNDILNAAAGDDSIDGGDGSDVITAGDGADTVLGGAGADSILGGLGNDSLDGGTGADTISGEAGDDSIAGGSENDFIQGGDGNDSLAGGSENDYLLGDAGNDTLLGEAGNDTINGGAGNDSIAGGSENDYLQGDAGNDTLLGEAGNDTINGNAGNDSSVGGDGADYLQDSEGNNTALGGAGNDTIYGAGLIEGGDDNDSLYYYAFGAYGNPAATVNGGAGNDYIAEWYSTTHGSVLDGGAGNDTINGSSYNESILGGSGNDSLNGQGGADTIDGGDGTDRVIYTGTIDQYTVLRDGSDFLVYDNRSGAPDGVDRLRNVETLVFSGGVEFHPTAANTGTLQTGTAANDALSGSAFGDQIDADAGNDTILGLGGNDILNAAAGDDSIDGGDGSDVITAGDGADTVLGGAGADSILGGLGNDSLDGGTGADTINGEAGDDSIAGGSENDSILGGVGNDSIDGGVGADTINGEAGDDSIAGGSENDFIQGGVGNDSLAGGSENDYLLGDAGNDTLLGEAGNDRINGDGGNDSSVGGDGADDLYDFVGNNTALGGAGNDTIYGAGLIEGGDDNDSLYYYAFGAYGNPAATVNGGAGNDYIAEWDSTTHGSVLDGGAGNDTINGSSYNESILGGSGNDSLNGQGGADSIDAGSGDDTINGGAWNDTIDGGSGVDVATYSDNRSKYLISQSAGVFTVQYTGTFWQSDGIDILTNVEILSFADDDLIIGDITGSLIEGGSGNDSLSGGAAADTIRGLAGNDTLSGLGGPDSIEGGDGNDRISGDRSNDTISGGAGADRLYGAEGDDSLAGGSENDSLEGNSGNDTLLGEAGNDNISGGAGNDSSVGGDGADYLQDSEGNNTALGGAGNDTIYGAGLIEGGADDDFLLYGTPYDYANATRTISTVFGGDGNDRIVEWFAYVNGTLLDGGAGNDTINGSSYNESIIGGSGNDSLNGQGGADSIDAGSDDDTISGGAGNDTIDGGDGANIAIYSGSRSQYSVIGDAVGFTIYDNRSGTPDGVDVVRNVGLLRFSDQDVSVASGLSGVVLDGTSANDAALIGTILNDTIRGMAGNDLLSGLAGNDLLEGGADNDTLQGGSGDDTIDGGAGLNRAVFSGNRDDYSISTIGGIISGTTTVVDLLPAINGNDGTDRLTNVRLLQFLDQTITLNNAPVVPALAINGTEDQAITLSIANLLAAASDADGDPLSFTSILSVSGGSAQISGGNLIYTPSANFFGNALIRYGVSDGFASTTADINIALAAVADAPQLAIAPANRSLLSRTNDSFFLAPGTFSDVDAGDSLTISASLASGDSLPSWLSFNATNLGFSLLNPAPAEAGSYDIRLTAVDSAGLSAEGSFNLYLENRAPSSIGLSAQIIDENAANGSVIGSISVSDANTNESQTLSLVNDAGGRFRLEGSNLVVADGSLLDYEQATSHLITLRSTDEALLSRDQLFKIQLANLIDSPPGTLNLAAASLQFQEGTPATVTVYRTNGVEGVVGATLRIVPGTFTIPSDIATNDFVFTLLPGQTSATLNLPIIDDLDSEGIENFQLQLLNPTGGAILGPLATAVVQLVDNDLPPVATPLVYKLLSNDSTPVISGSAVLLAGQQLQVALNGRSYRLGIDPELVQTPGDGWQLTIPAAHALANGTYNVVATISDLFGNSASDTTSGELRIDTIAPALSISSSSSSRDYFPLLSGSSEAGAQLLISWPGSGEAAVFQVVADFSGAWRLDTATETPVSGVFAPNRDGINAISLLASDAAGNTSSLNTSLTIRYPYPDLMLVDVDLNEGPALASRTLTATIANVAPTGPLLPAHQVANSWISRYYLSSDRIYGNGNDIALAGSGIIHSSPLAAGASLVDSVAFSLPETPGDYYFIAVLDATRSINEGLGEEGNIIIAETPIAVKSIYGASVAADLDSVNAGQSIQLTGSLDYLPGFAGTAGGSLGNKQVLISLRNTTSNRTIELQARTNADGSFSRNFTPTADQAGDYTISARWAANAAERFAIEDSFSVRGLAFSGDQIFANLDEDVPLTGIINLSNFGAAALTDLSLSLSSFPTSWQFSLDNSQWLQQAPGQWSYLGANMPTGNLSIAYSLTVPDATVLSDKFQLLAQAGGGALSSAKNFNIGLIPSHPTLQVSGVDASGSLISSMYRGETTNLEFRLNNAGSVASGPINVVLPDGAPWLRLNGSSTLAAIAPGGYATINLSLNPAADLPLATYLGSIGFRDEQYASYGIDLPFSFRSTSTATGSATIRAIDDFYYVSPGQPLVRDVQFQLLDRADGKVLQSFIDADGTYTFTDLPEGDYEVRAHANKHNSGRQTFTIRKGSTVQADVLLDYKAVQYSWVVTPTTIADQYRITLDATFETEVPLPVVTIDPGLINLCDLDVVGEQQIISLSLTNHGLVAARDLSFAFPSHPNYSFTLIDPVIPDLPAEQSLVVELQIDRIADVPNAPCTIDLGRLYWEYGTFLPNQVAPITIEKQTPLPFLLCPCEQETLPGVPPSPPSISFGGGGIGGIGGGGGGGGGGRGGGSITTVAPSPDPVPYVTARVKIQLNQEAVLSRGAFEGVFSLENLDEDAELTEIKIEIDVYDDDGNLVVTKFAVSDPLVSGFTAVDGSGELDGGETGTAIFTILANNEAAPMVPTDYRVGGRVSYLRNGLPVQFALAPAAITVTPPPVIKLDYFLQRDVFSDDPFTSFKEAPQPFVLGLLARNTGRGDAKDFTITSGEPQIIENELGLKIAFDLIGSSVNGVNNTVNPSLSVDLGNLGVGAVSEAHWLMTSSLQGRFIDYAAKVEYVNPLGFKQLAASFSQIENVTLHELTRMVRDDRDGADNRFDYLVNGNPPKVGEDNTGKDLLPDHLYLSNGAVEDVAVIAESDITVSGLLPLGTATISFVDANFADWDYLVIDDPSHGQHPILWMKRADGSFLDLQNVWITDRTFPEHGRPVYEYRLHLLDRVAHGESASYTIKFDLSATNNAPSLAVALGDLSVDEGSSLSFIVPSTTFTDVDLGDSLSYSATLEGGGSLPAWLSFNSATRTFAGAPTNANVGVIQVSVIATDSKGSIASDSFSITVQDVDAPVLQGITVEGNTLLLQFSEAITATAVPFTAFNIKVGATSRSVTAITADPIDPSRLLLTLAGAAPSPSQSLSLEYTDPLGNQITNVIQDADGFDLATIPQSPGFIASTLISAANVLSLAAGYENVILTGPGNLGAVGNANANRIVGNSGNNALSSLAGSDTLIGGDGNDNLNGGEGADSLIGGLGDDMLYGESGNDFLEGDDGNDVIYGGAGNDSLAGGAGNDTAVFSGVKNGYLVALLADGRTQVADIDTSDGDDGTDTLEGVETLQFAPDLIPPTAEISLDDILLTSGETATVTITFSEAVNGFELSDLSAGSGILSNLIAGDSNSYTATFTPTPGLNVSDNVISLAVGSYSDLADNQGAAASSSTYEVATLEVLNHPPTAVELTNTIAPLAENSNTSSRIKVADIAITDDSLGSNTISLQGADAAAFELDLATLFLKAGTSLDYETKSAYAVTVAVGDPTISGSSPVSTAYSLAVTDVNEAPTAVVLNAAAFDENISAGSLIATLNSSDPDTGNSFTYSLVAGSGSIDNDSFSISGNNLTINSSPNYETKSSYSLRLRSTDQGGLFIEDEFILLVNNLIEEISSASSITLPSDYENLILTGNSNVSGVGNSSDNSLTGNSGQNSLYGLAGNDQIFGLDGDDTLDGGLGDDTMNGGAGNDTFYVNSIGDLCSDAPGQGTDTVISSIGWALGNYIENLTLIGSDNINAWGNEWDNLLIGNDGDNVLNGNGGIDTMIGGLGDDKYIVDSLADIVTEHLNEGLDWVESSVNWVMGSNLENLILTGGANLSGTGNALGNRIKGNIGDNILDGGQGRDNLIGDAGADIFRFSNLPSYGAAGADRILDFSGSSGDRLSISKAAFGITNASASLIITNSLGLANALRTNNLFAYNTSNGYLYHNANGSAGSFGNGGIFAVLTNTALLQADWINLY